VQCLNFSWIIFGWIMTDGSLSSTQASRSSVLLLKMQNSILTLNSLRVDPTLM
jgi:hypothetical protein